LLPLLTAIYAAKTYFFAFRLKTCEGYHRHSKLFNFDNR
jgi:hypothetical protein